MKKIVLSFILFYTLLSMSAYANVYKCVDENGVATFSDQPCGNNAEIAFKDSGNSGSIHTLLAHFKETLPPNAGLVDRVRYRKSFKSYLKLVGSYVYPNEKFQIGGYFGPDSNNSLYEVRIIYNTVYSKAGATTTTVGEVKTFKENKPYSPPTMEGLKDFKMVGAGHWVR